MSLYTRIVSGALFPLHERLKGHDTVRARRALERSQWLPPAELEALRLARLRRLLARAGARVPYYRDLFRRLGFDPERVRALSDLERLPFLTKAEIRAHAEALKAEDARGLAPFNTGGSTGEPLVFWIGRERVTRDVAAKWRATRWWGVDIGDREIVVWGSPIELGAQDRLRELRDRLLRTRLLPAFEMSDARVREYLDTIRRFRPRMLFGYPSAIAHLARRAEAWGLRMDGLGIAVAFVTAERLYEDDRERIARVFGCRVANGYGGRDAGFVAHECPEGRMHITAEDVVVEIVDARGRALPPGEAGEIVVTHLATGDFPFIRYRTGDIGVLDPEPCPCGRSLPVLAEVRGRTTDLVVARDGTVMHALALIYVVREEPGIERFRIVQESLERTVVELVPGHGYDPACAGRIRDGIAARLGPGVTVEVRTVERIAPARSGKHRYVESRVAPRLGAAA